jgi:hypothetical protein
MSPGGTRLTTQALVLLEEFGSCSEWNEVPVKGFEQRNGTVGFTFTVTIPPSMLTVDSGKCTEDQQEPGINPHAHCPPGRQAQHPS